MSASPLMSVEQAVDRLLTMAEAQWIEDSEAVPLSAARQRVLANDLVAILDLPPWPNSAMDGYALNVDGWDGEPLTVSQQVFAGHAPEALAPGTCARIFTGAPVPPGANCVEMQENTEVLEDGRIRFIQPLSTGSNIRLQGQENLARWQWATRRGSYPSASCSEYSKHTVGAGLLAKRLAHSKEILADPPLSSDRRPEQARSHNFDLQ